MLILLFAALVALLYALTYRFLEALRERRPVEYEYLGRPTLSSLHRIPLGGEAWEHHLRFALLFWSGGFALLGDRVVAALYVAQVVVVLAMFGFFVAIGEGWIA